jgi:type I restriction enzyme S subunit
MQFFGSAMRKPHSHGGFRDRLIADVVTGQVDVRGWQPSPDDVVDDAALAALGDESEDVIEEEDSDGEE